MHTHKLLGNNINLGSYTAFVDTITSHTSLDELPYYVCVANVHMFVEAYQSADFAKILNGANLVTPDGKPLAWALRFLYGIRQGRVAGMDLLPDLLLVAEQKKIPVAFYGGTQKMLDDSRVMIKKRYPEVIIANMYSPPFRILTTDEEKNIINMINQSGARLLFVGLGCPKQEKWMASMQGRINAVMIGIGGALPVFAGLQKRAPLWMQKSGLEWSYRLAQEPVRLVKRYAKTNVLFIFLVLKEKYISIKSYFKG